MRSATDEQAQHVSSHAFVQNPPHHFPNINSYIATGDDDSNKRNNNNNNNNSVSPLTTQRPTSALAIATAGSSSIALPTSLMLPANAVLPHISRTNNATNTNTNNNYSANNTNQNNVQPTSTLIASSRKSPLMASSLSSSPITNTIMTAQPTLVMNSTQIAPTTALLANINPK